MNAYDTAVFPEPIAIEEYLARKYRGRSLKLSEIAADFDLAGAILLNQADPPAEKNLLAGQFITHGQPLPGGMFE